MTQTPTAQMIAVWIPVKHIVYIYCVTCHENHNPTAGLGNKTQQLSLLQTHCSTCEPL